MPNHWMKSLFLELEKARFPLVVFYTRTISHSWQKDSPTRSGGARFKSQINRTVAGSSLVLIVAHPHNTSTKVLLYCISSYFMYKSADFADILCILDPFLWTSYMCLPISPFAVTLAAAERGNCDWMKHLGKEGRRAEGAAWQETAPIWIYCCSFEQKMFKPCPIRLENQKG